MTSVDVYGHTHELDDAALDAIVARLEARGKQPVFGKIVDDYLGRLPLASIRLLLDLGCGTGVVSRSIARRPDFHGRIIGVDISPALVTAARRLSNEEGVAERIDYRIGDTHFLDFTDGAVDAVVAHTLASHVADPTAVLEEAARILRPGGWIVVFDGDYASLTLGTEDPDYGRRMDEAIIRTIAANPRIMRGMPRLLRDAGLELAAVIPHVIGEAGKADYWVGLLDSLRVLLPRAGVVTAEEARAFVDSQFKASAEGTFFESCNFYTCVAKRPPA